MAWKFRGSTLSACLQRMQKKDCHLLVAGRRHTPGAKAQFDFIDLIAKAEALAYLEAKAKAAFEEFFSSL